MALRLQVDSEFGTAAQVVQDGNGNPSSLAVSTTALGVGTTSPERTVHIVDEAPVDANTAQLGISTVDGNFILLGRAADYGFLQTHNRQPLSLNPIGNNVGVGTTAPQRKLHVVGRGPADANEAQFGISTVDGKFILLGRAADYGFLQTHNRHPLSLNPIGNNVGIGVVNPREKLEVNGNIFADGDVIVTGADCAEDFDVEDCEPSDVGSVVVIGDDEALRLCCEDYDKRVAGVLSGAGGCMPGVVLGRDRSRQHRLPVALNGKVFCKVDAGPSPIEVGDLLTTSTTSGHAMKATSRDRAFGAVLGKALRPLEKGKALLPVLVALQ